MSEKLKNDRLFHNRMVELVRINNEHIKQNVKSKKINKTLYKEFYLFQIFILNRKIPRNIMQLILYYYSCIIKSLYKEKLNVSDEENKLLFEEYQLRLFKTFKL